MFFSDCCSFYCAFILFTLVLFFAAIILLVVSLEATFIRLLVSVVVRFSCLFDVLCMFFTVHDAFCHRDY